ALRRGASPGATPRPPRAPAPAARAAPDGCPARRARARTQPRAPPMPRRRPPTGRTSRRRRSLPPLRDLATGRPIGERALRLVHPRDHEHRKEEPRQVVAVDEEPIRRGVLAPRLLAQDDEDDRD